MSSDKISLVLSGGGPRGAFHLGVLQGLDNAKISIEAISGSSIGSIVGASYLSGLSPREILKIFISKDFKKAIKFRPFRGGLFTIDEDAKIINELVNGYENIEDLPKPLYVCIVDIKKGETHYMKWGNIKKHLLASGAILPFFPPVEIDGKLYVDGGIMDNLPIKPLEDLSFPILGVNLHPNTPLHKDSLLSNLKRMFYLAWYSGVQNSIQKCDFYIAPHELTNFSVFKMDYLEELFDVGLKSIENILNNKI